ncbi:L,D-transpeptidase [Natronoglycomyces albus]|uniref:L,D-transpeptidase family protein n=1 Tax=Natronoglycomyces albus TaxID=2811108 RepID=A0A895XG06_9ACTN|nr:Ig-like domain-containing protein [Natronoglycomyces albus]QSB04264.1 L,D-transpeptidase family protein [Natronoglycomyces albus]
MGLGRKKLTRRSALSAGAALGVGTIAACSSDDGSISSPASEPESNATVTITPEDGLSGIAVSAEMAWEVEDGEFQEFSLTDAAGEDIPGAMHPDGTTWVPSSPLAYDTTYTAAVKAVDDEGLEGTFTAEFTTMSSPENRVEIADYLPGDGAVVGQAGVIAFEFIGFDVPQDRRREVERRLFVTSEPAQEGAWHWHNGHKLEYRPKEYWEPNTEISVRLALGGMPLSEDRFGQFDLTRSWSTSGELRLIEVDNDTKQMRVFRDGATVNTFDISLGEEGQDPDQRSFSGHMTIMSREREAVFGSEQFGYEDLDVEWAMRLTWSGQYIHAAPWARNHLGSRNVSHGCINLDDDDAEWLFEFVTWGDPITVSHTGRSLPAGDGFTTWDLSWEDHVAGSYAYESTASEEDDSED